MRVLVTGGAGYVGSVSVERLLEAGHEVVVLDDLTTGHATAVPAGARLEAGSYGEPATIARVLASHAPDAVLHCAARSLVAESMVQPARYYGDNVTGGLAMLDALRAAGVGRLVFSSTAAVYGVPDQSPIREDAVLRPINTYGETKRSFEGALAAYGRAYGLRSVSLRYFNAAGGTASLGEDHEPETHLIPNVLRAVESGEPVTIFGTDYPTPDGTCIRDYIHVADLADAHLRALEATEPGDRASDGLLVVNLGSGDGASVREVLDATARVVGRPVPHVVGDRRPGDPPVLVASNDLAAEVLGWRPARSSLEAMIGSAWEWRQRHPTGFSDRT